MTRMSESQMRSVATIGNSRVIPAKAGIHLHLKARVSESQMRSVAAIDNTQVLQRKLMRRSRVKRTAAARRCAAGAKTAHVIPAQAGIQRL